MLRRNNRGPLLEDKGYREVYTARLGKSGSELENDDEDDEQDDEGDDQPGTARVARSSGKVV